MQPEENPNVSYRSPYWSASLSSRQRVLLHAQPILMMRQNWAAHEDQAHYDPMCLCMKLFEVVIDQSGFGNEVVRQTVTDALHPLLQSLDRAAGVTSQQREHERIVDRLLDGLLNDTNNGQAFSLEYSEFDTSGRASRKTFSFKLLREVHGYSGEIALQLTSEAINLFLTALDLDIESEQIANEAVVQYQLERGKYDMARASAENARGQSMRYEDKIRRVIEQTKRDIRQVRWRDEVHVMLVEGIEHVEQRLRIEDDIIRSAAGKLDVMNEGDVKRETVLGIVRLMRDCRHRHLNLNKVLMAARGEFLEQQSRQCFIDISTFEVVNLRDDVLAQLLGTSREMALPVFDRTGHALLGPAAPKLLSLTDLLRWQFQPKRAYVAGEAIIETPDLTETDVDQHCFDDEVLQTVAKVFEQLDGPTLLSQMLAELAEDRCPERVQDAVVLEVLEQFGPDEDDAGFRVNLATRNGLNTPRCQGDDFWIEPAEEK